MKKVLTNLLSVLIGLSTLLLILMQSCQKNPDRSRDFTEEHLFTPGIEGPAVNSSGELFAVNFQKEGSIGKVDAQGNCTLFLTLPEGSVGNGIRFDKEDNMYIADYVGHNVLMVQKGGTEAAVFAHHDSLNQPNDLAMAPDGTLYASDPNWQEETGQLWRVDADGFHLLETGMGTTNGIEVSPDGKRLYVNESVQRKIWVYDIDGEEVKNKRLFYEFDDHYLDGMRCDVEGNLYVCWYDAGKVVVLNDQAQVIREVILKGKKPSNIAFGGTDRKQCFVTMADRGCFETFEAEFPGRSY